MYKQLFHFLAYVLCVNLAAGMQQIDFQFEASDRSYLLYKPKNFDASKPINLVVGVHGYSGTASAFEAEVTGGFNKAADKFNFLAVYPQGSYFYDNGFFFSSFNDNAGSQSFSKSSSTGETCDVDTKRFPYPYFKNCKNPSRCAWASCSNDLGFVAKVIQNIQEEFIVEDVYVVGNSNGGMFAQAFGCEYPDVVTGVMSVNGMQMLGNSCIPAKPVSFLMYGSFHDKTVPPINIRSQDGYFYEPMQNTIDEWSTKFECDLSSSNEYSNLERFVVTRYSGCKGGKQILSILNLDADHMWPETGYNPATGESSYFQIGYCKTDAQPEIIYPNCEQESEVWGTFFLLERLFSL